MGGNDVQRLEGKIDTVMEAIADLRVLVAGNYVTKAEFTEHQKIEEARIVALHQKIEKQQQDERAERWKMIGTSLTISAFVFGVIQWVVVLVKGGGNN